MPPSDTAIRKAKLADKPLRLFDGSDMYQEIPPVGGKLWRLKYRFAGKGESPCAGRLPDRGIGVMPSKPRAQGHQQDGKHQRPMIAAK
ncbi:MAG: Arm DNA-binding domain-containing protein [Pseudomonas sp.]